MNAKDKILIAKHLIESNYNQMAQETLIDLEDPRLKITLVSGIIIYLQYNNHEQYSYSVIFSNAKLDRSRFDNYDDRWAVSTKPHHYHPKHQYDATISPMRGDPNQDIPLLFDLLLSGKLFHR